MKENNKDKIKNKKRIKKVLLEIIKTCLKNEELILQ